MGAESGSSARWAVSNGSKVGVGSEQGRSRQVSGSHGSSLMLQSTPDPPQSLGFTDSVLELSLRALALLVQVFETPRFDRSESVSCFCLGDVPVAHSLPPSFLAGVCVDHRFCV